MRSIALVAPSRCAFACVRRVGSVVLAGLILLAVLFVPRAARAAGPWLFVNDVHFDPAVRARRPLTYGDTNEGLLESTLDEMHRLSPNPPVIVMAGDFLAHYFKIGRASCRERV